MDYNTRQSGTTTTTEIWRYSGTDWTSLKGFDVEATDGKIGSVDEQSDLTGASYIVVDTGPWIFGKKVLLPAGTIQRIDRTQQKVFVNRAKDQIKNAPEFDEMSYRTEEYRGRLGTYYGQGGPGWREYDERSMGETGRSF